MTVRAPAHHFGCSPVSVKVVESLPGLTKDNWSKWGGHYMELNLFMMIGWNWKSAGYGLYLPTNCGSDALEGIKSACHWDIWSEMLMAAELASFRDSGSFLKAISRPMAQLSPFWKAKSSACSFNSLSTAKDLNSPANPLANRLP